MVMAPVQSARQRRVALVIGNGAYRGGGFAPLSNPVNDASDMRAALARMGFEVEFGVDLDRNAMDLALVRFVRRAADADADVALVFFAGHGLQHDGINYMVPIDAAVDDAASLRLLPTAQNLLRDLRPERGARILVLDACAIRRSSIACRSRPVARRQAVASRAWPTSRVHSSPSLRNQAPSRATGKAGTALSRPRCCVICLRRGRTCASRSPMCAQTSCVQQEAANGPRSPTVLRESWF
jgi:hypothetical protein